MLRSEPRNPEMSKKRFIWMPQADLITAVACCMLAPGSRKVSLSRFWDRHSKYDNYFNDDPHRTSNMWVTEMHLSFCLLTMASSRGHPRGISTLGTPVLADFPSSEPIRKTTGLQVCGTTRKQISKVCFSFHFDGDFFDRYWTCHLVENMATPAEKWDLPFDIDAKGAQGSEWRQRKVLELYLCDRVLGLMLNGSKDILNEARQVLHLESGFVAYTADNDDEFKRRSGLWERTQPILRTTRDELTAAVNTLSKRAGREKAREGEAPRWTRKDEKKYRGILNKLEGSTSRKLADVKEVLNRIDALEKYLDPYFDKTRERLSNENMATFTYVTVIFLPLGFATSIFSMNGAPGTALVNNMAVLAVITFLVTIIVLINAKVLLGALNQLRTWIFTPLNILLAWLRLSTIVLDIQARTTMQSSRIFQSYTQRHGSEKTEEGPKASHQH